MNAVSIRLAVATDLDAILAIERANPSAAHWGKSEYARLFEESEVHRLALVAEAGGRVAGFVIAREVAKEWDLENIAVAPESQGQGVGSALLRELLRGVGEGRGEKLILEVRESNSAARRLYERAGLRLYGRRKDYYQHPPEDALLFEKNLQISV
jgi:ribosomal-protein-alanine acetyltransferase